MLILVKLIINLSLTAWATMWDDDRWYKKVIIFMILKTYFSLLKKKSKGRQEDLSEIPTVTTKCNNESHSWYNIFCADAHQTSKFVTARNIIMSCKGPGKYINIKRQRHCKLITCQRIISTNISVQRHNNNRKKRSWYISSESAKE